ncbi:MAG: preprotein translocase subunit SecG [Anaerosolibacter sp.]|uniref:Protein-export membrane protein SecG n=1 Tax=Anaerosolibacter carboniphilus TaxID=1417629 RepID=A0A841KMC0_9FIRM|nr:MULTISPECIES: preprotein translocase subunit SecG [Anaerosolibacter]MBB6214553.1 preprotein translocase subunit SecG [Anaerosolibacter carboniphilus]MDF2546758.1 preprotein translocase subunit SecG [Anaerosolibacter sp.]
MRILLMIVQIIASLILIGSILLQSGKSAGLSGAIAGGAEQLWGKQKGRGYEELLSKVTTIGAIVFIINSIILIRIF